MYEINILIMYTQPELHVEINIYKGPFPRFEQPKIIGYINLENLKFARQLREEKVCFDLNLHYDKAIHKPNDLDVKLTELLKFLLEHEARLNFRLETRLDNAKIFCYRGLMTCIACSPYETREPWKIVAILFKGNIYLCARDTEEKIYRRENMCAKAKLACSWGFKFEQYMLSDKPDGEPNPNVPVDETEEFSLVFTTKLDRHIIVYGAEMDGIRCDKGPVPDPPSKEEGAENIIQYLSTKQFIELKTQAHLQYPRHLNNFRRYKSKKWWCQSFLVGVDTILCGVRNDDGIVETLEFFPVKNLPKMSQKSWDPNVCFNFLNSFFTYVKRCFARKIKRIHGDQALTSINTLPLTTILFEWTPGMAVMVNENYKHEDDPILPDWFTQHYGKDSC